MSPRIAQDNLGNTFMVKSGGSSMPTYQVGSAVEHLGRIFIAKSKSSEKEFGIVSVEGLFHYSSNLDSLGQSLLDTSYQTKRDIVFDGTNFWVLAFKLDYPNYLHRVEKYNLNYELEDYFDMQHQSYANFYYSLTYKDNYIYIQRYGGGMEKYEKDGTFVMEDYEAFATRFSLTCDGNYIYATDSGGHKVSIYDENLVKQGEWGSYGVGNGEFYNLFGLDICVGLNEEEKEILVSDQTYEDSVYYNRIQAFTTSGVWKRTIKTEGSWNLVHCCFSNNYVYSNGDNASNNPLKKYEISGDFVKEINISSIRGRMCSYKWKEYEY